MAFAAVEVVGALGIQKYSAVAAYAHTAVFCVNFDCAVTVKARHNTGATG